MDKAAARLALAVITFWAFINNHNPIIMRQLAAAVRMLTKQKSHQRGSSYFARMEFLSRQAVL